jgi:uncharacterized membrane protein
MKTTRLEAFSDGVIAILITIMVLELKTPAGQDWSELRALGHTFGFYALSFVYLGIYWNNHHHMVHMSDRVSGAVLWANLHLLFWLSLIPFGTAWVGESEIAPLPTAIYGFVQMMAGLAYYILETMLIKAQGPHSRLQEALGSDFKGKISVALYAAAMLLAFVQPKVATAIYVGVAAMWLIPDRRIENHVSHPV